MMKSILCAAFVGANLFGLGAVFFASGVAAAQTADESPVLLIESLPSDNPDYRRMIYVNYLSAHQVDVTYRAYTRSEFAQVSATSAPEIISDCWSGAATSLAEIEAFQKVEAKRKADDLPPVTTRFCIKNVLNWEEAGRDRYLDPIFHGLPYAAVLNK